MTTKTPCQVGDPDDWFIEKDGRQYKDEPVLSEAEVATLAEPFGDDVDGAAEAVKEIVDEKLRQGQIKRRKARDACYDCPVRLECLDSRLEQKLEYGIWGGYYPEELKQIEDLRDRRRRGVE